MIKKLVLLAAVSSLVSCASFLPATQEQQVEKRVTERLEALRAADFKKAYTYMSPGYKTMNSPSVFEADHVGLAGMKGFRVAGINCETEDTCQVTVEIVVDLTSMVPGFKTESPLVSDMAYRERWVKLDGAWWFVKLD